MSEKSLEKRVSEVQEAEYFTPISELPDYYINAVIAIEDHRFYTHSGVDLIATSRAFVDNILSFKINGDARCMTGVCWVALV